MKTEVILMPSDEGAYHVLAVFEHLAVPGVLLCGRTLEPPYYVSKVTLQEFLDDKCRPCCPMCQKAAKELL